MQHHSCIATIRSPIIPIKPTKVETFRPRPKPRASSISLCNAAIEFPLRAQREELETTKPLGIGMEGKATEGLSTQLHKDDALRRDRFVGKN